MANPETIAIEVVYPLPQEQILFPVQVPAGSNLRQGIEASGILKRYPELR